ncbi:uncharacterized protein N7477_001677 [Penicillium maclennaniae]|uniref:uncharacterized protein n=1 Tax=Penicillium maclennaniae TaxID=1343394 RepID=UPI002541DAB0|nr:uncharacterized protein N7477_001677 [Penicillium maclennaniae]KAJ5681737.1 hypothetical protein N7477_001677 [Penicillium maclennaniae]
MQDESIETNLPRTIPEWKARAKTLKVLTKCPNDLKILSSGSKVTFKEYLTMRIIRPEVQAIEIFPHDYSSEAEAKKIIKADTTFEKWFSKVETNIRPDKDLLGMFALVKFAQLQVTKHESLESPEPPFERAKLRPRPSVPVEGSSEDAQHETSTPASAGTRVTPAEDTPWARFSRTDAEEEVNFFLLNLLNAFTLSLNPDIRCEWSAHRNPFHAVSFGEIDMTTHVDGYLRAIGKDEAFAILEVKAAERNHRNAPQVMWQEGAEMVAWILCDESKNREYPFSKYVR